MGEDTGSANGSFHRSLFTYGSFGEPVTRCTISRPDLGGGEPVEAVWWSAKDRETQQSTAIVGREKGLHSASPLRELGP